jgi:hypothetical protein
MGMVQRVGGSSLNGVWECLKLYTTDFPFLSWVSDYFLIFIEHLYLYGCFLCYHDIHDYAFFLLYSLSHPASAEVVTSARSFTTFLLQAVFITIAEGGV